jgi:arsenite-transporting ATPase
MGLMRVILFTGKGGVGKTSVAAASALRSAELGHKTLVMSTDAAHSLADAFDLPLGGEPRPLAPNLWGQETDMAQAVTTYWGTIQTWLATFLTWRGMDEVVAQEMAILPGMEELANLLYILQYYEQGDYDAIIVDCAPTGETLRLLSFPEVLKWWMDKVFPLERKAARALRPLVKGFIDIPFPEDEVFRAVETLYQRLDKMRAIFAQSDQASVRLVVNPEKMVIKEAQRTFTYLHLYGYATDLIIVNRLLPEKVKDSYFASWREAQVRYQKTIEESFSPVPIRSIPFFSQEVVGLEMLREMASSLYGEEDPLQLFFSGQVQTIQKEDSGYVLSLGLPLATKEKLALFQSGDELIIHVGSYRRNVILPRSLVGLAVAGASLENSQLKIRFQARGKEDEKDTGDKERR